MGDIDRDEASILERSGSESLIRQILFIKIFDKHIACNLNYLHAIYNYHLALFVGQSINMGLAIKIEE